MLQYQYAVCWHVAKNAVFRANAALGRVKVKQQITNIQLWTISIVGLLDEHKLAECCVERAVGCMLYTRVRIISDDLHTVLTMYEQLNVITLLSAC